MQPWPKVEAALLEMYGQRQAMLKTGIKIMNKIYIYLRPVCNVITSKYKKPSWPLERAMFNLVEEDLIRSFLADPNNKEVRDVLSLQIMMAYCVAGGPLPVDMYDEEEMASIAKEDKEVNYYNHFVFAHTLRRIIDGVSPMVYLPSLSAMLVPGSEEERSESYEWEYVFAFQLLLHTLWHYFHVLPPEDQETLVKNYLYLGVVGNAPLGDIIDYYINYGQPDAASIKDAQIVTLLKSSNEKIPISTDLQQTQTLNEIVGKFFIREREMGGGGFAQEEFIKQYYQGQPNQDKFRAWLREVLTIIQKYGPQRYGYRGR